MAGKFTVALSRVMDKSPGFANPSIGGSPEKTSDLMALLEEINDNDNLTVKLSSISKIVASLNPKGSSSSLAKKKLEETLAQTVPEVKEIFAKFKEQLKDLQEQKDEAMEDYLEEHNEKRLKQTKKIKSKYA